MRVQVFDTQQGMHNHLPTTAFPPKEPPLENHLPTGRPAGPTAAGCRVSLGGGPPSQNPEAAVPRRAHDALLIFVIFLFILPTAILNRF